MTPRDDSPLHFDAANGEEITVTVENDINIFPDVNYALAGQQNIPGPKPREQPCEFDVTENPTVLAVTCTFADAVGGGYTIRVKGNAGDFASVEPYKRRRGEASHTRNYTFFIV